MDENDNGKFRLERVKKRNYDIGSTHGSITWNMRLFNYNLKADLSFCSYIANLLRSESWWKQCPVNRSHIDPMVAQCWPPSPILSQHRSPTCSISRMYWIIHHQCIYGLARLVSSTVNPLTAKLFNLNFHPLEVVSRWRDPQLQVSENYSDLTKWRSTLFQSCWLMSHFIFIIFKIGT